MKGKIAEKYMSEIMHGKQRKLTPAPVREAKREESVEPEAGPEFVETPYVQELTQRAMIYLSVGYPVHFAGPPGTGKTTLAFHAAAQLGRPVTMIHGDDEFGSSDLIGRNSGYDKRKLIDNYVRNVLKTEETMKITWADNRLTQACRDGHTLIYDEFTRSRPEANNALLSILEEKFLNLPKSSGQGSCFLEVHPDFRAIFTSNPEEYAGVHKTQDALMDRLITVNLGHFDRETEVRIAMAKSGISRGDAETIVEVVRQLRDVGVTNYGPTIRACIAIARILANAGARAQARDPVFRWVVRDVLCTETPKVTRDGKSVMGEKVEEVIRKVCGSGAAPRVRKVQGEKELKKDHGGEICRSPVEV